MHIGLIGGIGPAATDVYYRSLINHARERGRDLELTIVHADSATLLENLSQDRKAEQCAIYARLTERLERADAECVVVTSVAGHFCIDMFGGLSRLPIIDLTDTVADWLRDKGMSKVGILGTRTVMASGMYGKLSPVDVLAPKGSEIQRVHEAYVTLAQTATPTPALEEVFDHAAKAMLDRGAEAILLGGTDLNAVYQDGKASFPVVDCAGIHIARIAALI